MTGMPTSTPGRTNGNELRRAAGLVVLMVVALAGLIAASRSGPPAGVEDSVSEPVATLTKAAERLSRSKSVGELGALARDGHRLLWSLDPKERDALGRGLIRFRVDRPVVVTIAAPRGSEPFWLADRGFAATGQAMRNAEGVFDLYGRPFPAGQVELGVNGLDRSPPAHYAAFVRAQEPRAAIRLSDLRPGWCRAIWVESRGAVSPDAESFRPFEDLPDDLVGATLIQTARSHRHDAVLATSNHRVWKTHVPATLAADQVAVSFGADAATSLTWTWRTRPEVRPTRLRLALASENGPIPRGPIRVLEGESALVEVPSLWNDPVIRRHAVRATGLEPETRYAYALGDGSPEGWSAWQTIRTAPGAGRDLTFLYLGDAQCGFEAWGKLLARARRDCPGAAFVLMAGDLVDRGNERSNWDHFFLRARGVFEGLPLMPCVGNHEYLDRGPRLYQATFALPGNGPEGLEPGLAYSFESGDALFAILDSTAAVSDPGQARRQAEWLDARLARSPARWRFVMFHHPAYASHPTRDYPMLREVWVPVFDRHRVDMVLQGHDHAYLRTDPMRAGRRVGPGEGGTVYVVSVSGEKFVDQAPRDYTARGFTHTATYQTISLRGPRLTYRALDAQGREVDALVIEKAESGRLEPAARAE